MYDVQYPLYFPRRRDLQKGLEADTSALHDGLAALAAAVTVDDDVLAGLRERVLALLRHTEVAVRTFSRAKVWRQAPSAAYSGPNAIPAVQARRVLRYFLSLFCSCMRRVPGPDAIPAVQARRVISGFALCLFALVFFVLLPGGMSGVRPGAWPICPHHGLQRWLDPSPTFCDRRRCCTPCPLAVGRRHASSIQH